jgi:hypothetical protein
MTVEGASVRPSLVVCEDGDEYLARFRRLLGETFVLTPATGFAQAKDLLEQGATAILLDLDFRRAEPAKLVDEHGRCQATLSDGERRRLAGNQGILILRALRDAGITAPALLFADLDDEAQAGYLRTNLAPLVIVPSSESLPAIAAHIRDLVPAR